MRIERNTNVYTDLNFAPRQRAIEVASETRCVANVTLYPRLAALTVNGIPIAVSPKEFALARTLFEHAGEVVAHERCFAALGGAAGLKSARLLRVYIFALRQKLRAAGAMTDLATVRGRGYVMREPPAADRPVCTLRHT